MRKTELLLLTLLSAVMFFTFPVSVSAQRTTDFDCSNNFQPLVSTSQSIQYKEVQLQSPRTMMARIVKVDLTADDIDIATTPRILLGRRTTDFRYSVGAAVAINGGGWTTTNSEPFVDPSGLSASQGDIYSNEDPGMTLFVSEQNEANLYTRPNRIWDAVTGFTKLIENGNIYSGIINCNPALSCTGDCVGRGYCTIRARTSIGLTDNNEELIMVVVDEGISSSAGASVLDMANIMKECGADNAVNMDGGGSSTLAVDPDNNIRNGDELLNHPSDSTGERSVANHLAICIGDCTIPSSISILPNNIRPTETALPRYSPGSEYPFACNLVAPENSFFGDDEFHSLRPYQASPCNPNKEDLALFCGNDLFIGDPVVIEKRFDEFAGYDEQYFDGTGVRIYSNPPFDPSSSYDCWYCDSTSPGLCVQNPDYPNCIPWSQQCSIAVNPCGDCEDSADGVTERCSFTITSSKTVSVELSNAEFPIMGYTEPSQDNLNESDPKVINSINPEEETLDDATKMNEYVSWYLNGVNGRAEYPYNNPDLNCVGQSTGKAGTCMDTRYDSSGNQMCLGTWGIPFIEPFEQPFLIADGKSICTGTTSYCCVSKNLPTFVEQTPGSTSIVNYSGPIKKLLPFSIQNIERTEEVAKGYGSDHEDSSNDRGDQIRHSQVVGCDFGTTFNLFNLTTVSIGGIITKCYLNGNTFLGRVLDWLQADEALLEHQRLTDFYTNTPPIEDSEDWLGENVSRWAIAYKDWRGKACLSLPVFIPIVGEHIFYLCYNDPLSTDVFGNLFSYVPMSSTEDRVGDVKIKSARVGTRSYSPNIRVLYSRVTNVENADLYFPHMEESVELADLLQKTFAYKDSDRDNMDNSGFVPDSPYCEYRQVRTNPGDDLFAGGLSADIDYSAQVSCTFFNRGGTVLSNGTTVPYGNLCTNTVPGGQCVSNIDYEYTYCDNYYYPGDCAVGETCCSGEMLSAPGGPCHYGNMQTSRCVPINYTGCNATTDTDVDPRCTGNFKCVDSPNTCMIPLTTMPNQSCSNEVMVNLRLETRTPLADKAWSKLVAGSAGVFRKMFPRIGSNDQIEGIIDMPANTQVDYDGNGTIYAGSPSNQLPGSVAQLYFPHIGGIKEYFLTGIQTLIRPKGMGQQPEFCEGDDCAQGNSNTNSDDDSVSPSVDVCSQTCSNSALEGINMPLPNNIRGNFMDLVSRWVDGCTPNNTTLASIENKYDQVTQQAYQAGMNPVFALSIWLNESGASNYQCLCHMGNDTAQDFGQNRPELETLFSCPSGTVTTDRFQIQLSRFLNNPSYYLTLCPTNNFACEWERFGAIYHYGECSSSDAANTYINSIRNIYNLIAPGLVFPCYPISINPTPTPTP